MIEALGVLGVAACAWAALVAVVRWAAPWLQARVLPHGVTVSASWACIAVNSELVPRFLRTQQRSQAPAHTALHSHDAVLDMGADLDSDSGADSDDADEQAAAARPQRRGRRGRSSGARGVWQMFCGTQRGWSMYYSVGAAVACLLGLCVLAACVLNPFVLSVRVRSAVSVAASTGDVREGLKLLPRISATMMGLGLGPSDLLVAVAAVAVCGVVHELGHAHAAATQGFVVRGLGLELWLGVVPKFFVDIDGALRQAPTRQALRVYCAGVWHNVLLAVAALGGAVVVSMAAMALLYVDAPQKPVVTAVAPNSPMAEAGVAVGDVVLGVGLCHVDSVAAWEQCLTQLPQTGQAVSSDTQSGFCVPKRPGMRPSNGAWWTPEELQVLLERLLHKMDMTHHHFYPV